jgi:multidrug efflux pump subunit AcrA (membrane-fusion protein)
MLMVALWLIGTPVMVLADEDSVPVSVTRPYLAELGETLKLSGSVNALQRASLSTRVDGLIADLQVDVGSRVKQGDPLLQLDAALITLEYQRARAATAEQRAALDEAQRLLDDALRLRENNHVSANEVNTRRANLNLAQASLEAAIADQRSVAEMVERHVLPAPFNGVIAARHVDRGEWISRGDPVFELVSLKCFSGAVAALVPVSDSSSRTFLIRIRPKTDQESLLPGTSANAVFELGDRSSRNMLLPRDALLRHPDGSYSVFVASEGIARRQLVEIGREARDKVVITGGLATTDEVVIRGNEVLRDGQALHVVESLNP